MSGAARRHRRRTLRLPGYDYTQPGAYFVTLCTHRHRPLFGEVVDGVMQLHVFGQIVRRSGSVPQKFAPKLCCSPTNLW